jgi:hypothetical protein
MRLITGTHQSVLKIEPKQFSVRIVLGATSSVGRPRGAEGRTGPYSEAKG